MREPERPGLIESLSCIQLCVTPRTTARQAPQSMGFPRLEYWSELPFPSPQTGMQVSWKQLGAGI